LGDIAFNEWVCSDCKGSGLKPLIPDGYIVVEGEGNDETFGFASSIDGLVNEHINDRIVEFTDNEMTPPLLHIVPFVLIK
jgi:hypothetical protein